MLHIKLIIKLDKKTNRSQFRLNNNNNNTDINRRVCVQVGILIAFQKLQTWYVGGANMTQFSCCLYTQG